MGVQAGIQGRRSADRGAVDRHDAENGEPEIREALQQAMQLRLITYDTHEDGVSVVSPQAHAREQTSNLVAQLAFGLEPIGPGAHHRTLTHALPV